MNCIAHQWNSSLSALNWYEKNNHVNKNSTLDSFNDTQSPLLNILLALTYVFAMILKFNEYKQTRLIQSKSLMEIDYLNVIAFRSIRNSVLCNISPSPKQNKRRINNNSNLSSADAMPKSPVRSFLLISSICS